MSELKELNYEDIIEQQAKEMEQHLAESGQHKKLHKSPRVKKMFDSLDYFKEKEEENKKHPSVPSKV